MRLGVGASGWRSWSGKNPLADSVKLGSICGVGFLISNSVFVPSVACVEPEKERSRCQMGRAELIAPIRGTGYYWLEYLGDFSTEKGAKASLLLVQGERPIFPDRAETSTEKSACSQNKIVADLGIVREGIELSLDCHVVDDQPLPLGEVTIGFLEDSTPGLRRPISAWRAEVFPQGKGGEIKPIDSSRVLCVVLGAIDDE
jgi:hypothetical protein